MFTILHLNLQDTEITDVYHCAQLITSKVYRYIFITSFISFPVIENILAQRQLREEKLHWVSDPRSQFIIMWKSRQKFDVPYTQPEHRENKCLGFCTVYCELSSC